MDFLRSSRGDEKRYEPDQPHGPGGQFGKVARPRPGHGQPSSGHPLKKGQDPGPAPVVPTKGEPGGGTTGSGDDAAPAAAPQSQTPATVPPPLLPEGLSPEQTQAVQAWLGPQQQDIQAQASSGNKGPYDAIIAALSEAILQSPALDHDQIVYVGLPPGDLSQHLKPHTLFQGSGFRPTSTTALPVQTRAIELTVPRGSKGLQLPGELLLPRGSRIRIDEVPLNGNVAGTYMGSGPAATHKGDARGIVEDSELDALLSRYRVLWMQADTREQRESILKAVDRVKSNYSR